MRSSVSTHCPTGRAALNQLLATITTAMPSSANAIPSRRWRGSISPARPTERAAPPAPLATISHAVCTPRPIASAPAVSGAELLDLRRLAGFLRAAGREPLRELAFDLVVRLPERAAVLLGMSPSLVACTSFAPFATLATASGG